MVTPQQPANILLVDDHPQNLLALSAILQNPDYNLVPASSGPEALGLLLKQDFAVILLDVMMPGMSGFEVAAAIKGREKTRTIPIIFVTAVATDVNDIYRGYSVGAVDYIQKPLDPDVVRAKVSVFVDLYRAKEEIKRQADLIQKSEQAKFLSLEQEARHRAEAAEKRYYDLINWVDHAVLWEYDAVNFRFAFVSQRSIPILGFSPEEWLNDPDFFFSRVHKEERDQVRKVFDEAIEDGKDGRAEHRFLNQAGEQIWVYSGVHARKDPLGKVNLLWGLTLDISPFKIAEETQRFLAQASAIFGSSLDYRVTLGKVANLAVPTICDWCTVDIVEGGSPIRFFATDAEPEIKKWAEDIQKKYAPRLVVKSPILDSIRTGEPILIRSVTESDLVRFAQNEEHLQLMRKIGFQSMMIAPLQSRGKTFGAITFISSDRHHRFSEKDLKFAEELAWHAGQAIENSRLYGEAQQAIRIRENVLGIVSHDLKSPLTAIGINLQMIAKGGKVDPKVYAEKALRSLERMDRMIRDLLDLGKIEAGQMKYEMKECKTSALLSDVFEIMQPIGAASSVTIERPSFESEITITCDKDRIQQVLTNVIGNAVKFSPMGSTVRIGLAADGGKVDFWITDSGPGIAQEELSHVFEPYWQAPVAKRKEGTGLGLYISKRIVEAHGGRIWIDSQTGKGTTVHFVLPQTASPAKKVSEAA